MAEKAKEMGVFALCLPGAKRGGRQEPPWFAIAPCRMYAFGPGNGVCLAIHNCVHPNVPLTLRGNAWACSDPLTGRTMWEAKDGDSEEQFVQELEYVTIPHFELTNKAGLYDLMREQRKRFGPAPHPKNLHVRLSTL